MIHNAKAQAKRKNRKFDECYFSEQEQSVPFNQDRGVAEDSSSSGSQGERETLFESRNVFGQVSTH